MIIWHTNCQTWRRWQLISFPDEIAQGTSPFHTCLNLVTQLAKYNAYTMLNCLEKNKNKNVPFSSHTLRHTNFCIIFIYHFFHYIGQWWKLPNFAQVKTASAFYGSCLLLLYKTIQWGSQTNKNNAQLQLKCLIGTDWSNFDSFIVNNMQTHLEVWSLCVLNTVCY